MHRLFVCIAGVADQLQTNFASDLRRILRSVFLLNVSPEPLPPNEDVNGGGDQRGEELLFEYRPNESDVLLNSATESNSRSETGAGSNQSINSAEEVNPDSSGESVFEDALSSNGLGAATTNAATRSTMSEQREQVGMMVRHSSGNAPVTRSHSLGDTTSSGPVQEADTGGVCGVGAVDRTSHSSLQGRLRTVSSSGHTEIGAAGHQRPIAVVSPEQQIMRRRNEVREEEGFTERPPRWIPDEDAPRCMSCATLFTAFRRRHHCRNCGKVFCASCSAVSTPLPKFGITKAVRVCQACFDS